MDITRWSLKFKTAFSEKQETKLNLYQGAQLHKRKSGKR